jgi:hypothetical protein
MRSHGVPSFPDPGGSFSPGIKQNPAFGPAMQRCNKLLPSGTATSAGLPEAQRATLLAQAACIRTHSVPNFPDPTFPLGGGCSTRPYQASTPAHQRLSAPLRHAA